MHHRWKWTYWAYALSWLLAPALLFLPFLFFSRAQFFGNSDALFYSSVLAMTSDALRAGRLLPAWFAEANAGFGSPVMLFYAPLSYLATALATLPFSGLKLSIEGQFLLGIYASQVASGAASFFWLKRRFTANVAWIGSLLFVLLPYKLVYIYVHVNLAQLWALALLPLWMRAVEDMAAERKNAIAAYALVMAAVYYTHPLTLIAFGFVPVSYALWFGRGRWRGVFMPLCAAHVLAGLMSASQLIPALRYREWIHAERFLQDNYYWAHNFFHVDVFLCGYYAVIAFLVGWTVHRAAPTNERVAGPVRFWAIVLAVVLFLTQKISFWVWQIMTPLQYLQFPAARLHACALMAVTYLCCVWLEYDRAALPREKLCYPRATLFLVILIGFIATGWHVYAIKTDPQNSSESYRGDALLARIIPAAPHSVYETKWGCIDAGRAYGLLKDHRIPPQVVISFGQATVSDIRWQPPVSVRFTAQVRSEHAEMVIRQCYLPLWEANDDGKPIILSADTQYGTLAFSLPRGQHAVALTQATPHFEKLLNVLSLAAWMGAAGWFAWRRMRP